MFEARAAETVATFSLRIPRIHHSSVKRNAMMLLEWCTVRQDPSLLAVRDDEMDDCS